MATRKKTTHFAPAGRAPAEVIRRQTMGLKDEPLVAASEAFGIERSLPHGHVEAVLETIRSGQAPMQVPQRRQRDSLNRG